MGQPMGEMRFYSMMAASRTSRGKSPKALAPLESKHAPWKTGPLSEEQMQTSLRTLSKRAYQAIQQATGLESPTIIDFKKLIDSGRHALYRIGILRGVGIKTAHEICEFAYQHGLCIPPAKPFEDLAGRERTWTVNFFREFNIGCKDDLAEFVRIHPDWEDIFMRAPGCGPLRLNLIKAYVAGHIPARDSGITPQT